jgi:hypothetical protein
VKAFGLVGGADARNNVVVSEQLKGFELRDPLAGVPEPKTDGLEPRGTVEVTNQTFATLAPGLYFNLRIKGSKVVLKPGLYVVLGEFITDGSQITGRDVTLCVGEKFGISGATLMLTAPTSGDYKYLAVFHSRRTPERMEISMGDACSSMERFTRQGAACTSAPARC